MKKRHAKEISLNIPLINNKENDYKECINSIAGIMSILEKSKQSRSQKMKVNTSYKESKSPISNKKQCAKEVVQRMEIDNLRRNKLKEQFERIKEEKKMHEAKQVEKFQKSKGVMTEKEKQLLTDKLMQDAYRRQKQKERMASILKNKENMNITLNTNYSQSHCKNQSLSPFRSNQHVNEKNVLLEFLNQSIIQFSNKDRSSYQRRQNVYKYFDERTSPIDIDLL